MGGAFHGDDDNPILARIAFNLNEPASDLELRSSEFVGS